MSKTRIKQISFLLALIMLFGAMSLTIVATDDTEYYATINTTSAVYVFATAAWGDGVIVSPSELPSVLTVKKANDNYYYVTNPAGNEDNNWPIAYDGYRYISVNHIVLGDPIPKDITKSDLVGFLNSLCVGLNGNLPEGASIALKEIPESMMDKGISDYIPTNMSTFVGAYDIKVMQGETEWQPATGEKIKVAMNASAWGFLSGQTDIFIIHMHENEDGTKTYKTYGPMPIENGLISFEVENFSTFAVFQGTGTVHLTDGDNSTIWVEKGTVLTLIGKMSSSLIQGSGNAAVTLNKTTSEFFSVGNNSTQNITISVLPSASEGESDTFTATWNSNVLGIGSKDSATITIQIGTRTQVIENSIGNYGIMIAIKKPNADGTFPSEPSSTVYSADQYHFLTSLYTMSASSGVLSNKASDYLDAVQISNSDAWMYDVNGQSIGGVVDAKGDKTKALFVKNGASTIDWNKVAAAIAAYNDADNTLSDGTADDIVVRFNAEINDVLTTQSVTLTAKTDQEYTMEYWVALGQRIPDGQPLHYSQFNLVPYVVKIMKSSDTSGNCGGTYQGDTIWHVDIALTRSGSITLGYDLNLDANFTTSTNVALPNASVYIEDPLDADEKITIPVKSGLTGSQGAAVTQINVVNTATGGSATLRFDGWCQAEVVSDEYPLIVPSETASVTIEGDTVLYAVWTVIGGDLKIATTTLVVSKRVELISGAPDGATVPAIRFDGTKDADFSYFTFNINISYLFADAGTTGSIANRLSKITLTGVKINPSNGAATEITETALADLISGTATLDFVKINKTDTALESISFDLCNGESLYFLNVPFFKDDAATTDVDESIYNVYTISETIPNEAKERYSTTQVSQTATLSETNITAVSFINVYDPPVSGIRIKADKGDAGEYYIYLVEGNNVSVKVAVPAGGAVTVTGLLNGTYTVTEETSWNNLWFGSDARRSVELNQDGETQNVDFAYSPNGNKWLFGHMIFKR